MNYTQFMSQLQSFVERYQDEFITNRSVGRLEPSESKGFITNSEPTVENSVDSAAVLLTVPTPRGV